MMVMDGRDISVEVTHLRRGNHPPHTKHHAKQPILLECPHISSGYYRYLYLSVGRDYLWCDRSMLDDEALMRLIHAPNTRIFHILVDGEPAGFFETSRDDDGPRMLTYFGLLPSFTGRGLGPWLLDQAILVMLEDNPPMLGVETCNLDHPRALLTYQTAGFEPFARESRMLHVPKDFDQLRLSPDVTQKGSNPS